MIPLPGVNVHNQGDVIVDHVLSARSVHSIKLVVSQTHSNVFLFKFNMVPSKPREFWMARVMFLLKSGVSPSSLDFIKIEFFCACEGSA